MKLLNLFNLIAINILCQSALAANLPVGKAFKVSHYSSGTRCDLEKMRNPSSACVTKPQAIPETITIVFSQDAKGKHFVLKSPCRTMKGNISSDNEESIYWKSTALIDHCGNQNLSLIHDAVFTRLLETDHLVPVGDTVQAQGKGKIDLTFTPISAKVAAR